MICKRYFIHRETYVFLRANHRGPVIRDRCKFPRLLPMLFYSPQEAWDVVTLWKLFDYDVDEFGG